MYDKARDTVTGTAAKVQQGAYDLKDRVIGTGSSAQPVRLISFCVGLKWHWSRLRVLWCLPMSMCGSSAVDRGC